MFLVILVFGLISCSVDTNNEIELRSNECSFENMKFGKIHNLLLKDVILEYEFCETPSENSLISFIKPKLNNDLLYSEYGFERNKFIELVNNSQFTDLTNIMNGNFNTSTYINSININSSVKIKILELNNLILQMDENSDVGEIQNFVCQYYQQQSIGLIGNDKLFFDIFCDVAYHSCEFWLPTDKGGANYAKKLSDIITDNCESKLDLRFGWGKFFLTDAVCCVAAAATSVVDSGGLSAVPNPALGGLPTAGVVGVIGGLGGSAAYAIGAS